MLPTVELVLVTNLSSVDWVREQIVEVPGAVPTVAPHIAAARRDERTRPLFALRELDFEFMYTAEFEVAAEDHSNDVSFLGIDNERPIFRAVTRWDETTHPQALFLGGCDLVADALACDLALELGKGEEHVQ